LAAPSSGMMIKLAAVSAIPVTDALS